MQDSKPVPRATACQASCSALPTCQAYYAFFSANTPEAVTCVRLRISSTNYLRALGSFTGIKDQCADFANQYTPAQQAACYDSPPIMYASARARARRSIIRAPNNSLCTDGETSCPVKKIDGTLGSGSECVDVSRRSKSMLTANALPAAFSGSHFVRIMWLRLRGSCGRRCSVCRMQPRRLSGR